MEVRVLASSVAPLPEGCFIAIRVGDQQKQTAYDPQKLYRFPEVKRFGKIDVYQRLGTCDLTWGAEEPEKRKCKVLAGDSDIGMELDVELNRMAETYDAYDRTRESRKVPELSSKARKYLRRHGVETLLTGAMRALLKQMPEDAGAFLSHYILANYEAPQPEAPPAEEQLAADACRPDSAAAAMQEPTIPDDASSKQDEAMVPTASWSLPSVGTWIARPRSKEGVPTCSTSAAPVLSSMEDQGNEGVATADPSEEEAGELPPSMQPTASWSLPSVGTWCARNPPQEPVVVTEVVDNSTGDMNGAVYEDVIEELPSTLGPEPLLEDRPAATSSWSLPSVGTWCLLAQKEDAPADIAEADSTVVPTLAVAEEADARELGVSSWSLPSVGTWFTIAPDPHALHAEDTSLPPAAEAAEINKAADSAEPVKDTCQVGTSSWSLPSVGTWCGRVPQVHVQEEPGTDIASKEGADGAADVQLALEEARHATSSWSLPSVGTWCARASPTPVSKEPAQPEEVEEQEALAPSPEPEEEELPQVATSSWSLPSVGTWYVRPSAPESQTCAGEEIADSTGGTSGEVQDAQEPGQPQSQDCRFDHSPWYLLPSVGSYWPLLPANDLEQAAPLLTMTSTSVEAQRKEDEVALQPLVPDEQADEACPPQEQRQPSQDQGEQADSEQLGQTPDQPRQESELQLEQEEQEQEEQEQSQQQQQQQQEETLAEVGPPPPLQTQPLQEQTEPQLQQEEVQVAPQQPERPQRVEGGVQTDAPEEKEKFSGTIHVHVLGAKNLRAADIGGRSDPYCVLQILGKPHMQFRTKTLYKNLEPFWDELFEVSDFCEGDVLEFTVMDYDWRREDDFLGSVALPSQEFCSNAGFEGDLRLRDLKGQSGPSRLRVKVTVPALASSG